MFTCVLLCRHEYVTDPVTYDVADVISVHGARVITSHISRIRKLRHREVKGLAKVTKLETTKYLLSACCCLPGTTPGPAVAFVPSSPNAKERPEMVGGHRRGCMGEPDGLECMRWGHSDWGT